MSLSLQNPHSVLAVLDTRPHDVIDVRISSRNPSGSWNDIAERAKQLRIPVSVSRGDNRGRRHERTSDPGRGGASSATVKPHADVTLEQLFATNSESPEHGLYLALDCLQDPHNVGAIFRAAAFFGVKGIVLTKDRSAPLNAAVYDVASGGVEYTQFSLQTNLSRALDVAKESGVWVLGTSERAEVDYTDVPRDRRWLLVMGNEEKGMRRLTTKSCDVLCGITPHSPVSSLNVSVAAGILIAHFGGPA